MTEPEPPIPPEGYSFLTGDLTMLAWQHPSDQYAWVWPQEAAHFVVTHEECGAFIVMAKVEAHDAWHASLAS